jgi:quercetin dioxygenase-like cupin family protein
MEIRLDKEIIFNPVTSERLLVLESTADIFKMGFSIDPHSEIAGEHFHPSLEQTILVTAGELHCSVNGKNHALRVGESVTVPAGARHFQWNPTDTEAWAIEEYRPAGRMHNFFRVLFKLAQEGKTNHRGIPHPLIGAALTAEFKDTVRVTSPGLRLLFGVLAPFSRLLGYRKTIRGYIATFEMADKRAVATGSNLMPFVSKTEKV